MSDFSLSFKKIIVASAALLAAHSAFAIAPCSAIENYAQLVQAGSCYFGPNNSITLSGFSTNLPSSSYAKIAVYTNAAGTGAVPGRMTFPNTNSGTANPGEYAIGFDVSSLGVKNANFSMQTSCDGSCVINDGDFIAQDNYNVNQLNWTFNGVNYSSANSTWVHPAFNPWVSNVQASGTISANSPVTYFAFEYNLEPTSQPGWPLIGQCTTR